MEPSSVVASSEASVVSQNGRVTSRQYSSRNETSMASVEMNVSVWVMLIVPARPYPMASA